MSAAKRREGWGTRLPGLALALVCLFLLSACSDDEEARGQVVAPPPGPRVDESVLALDVMDGVPLGITDFFLRGEVVHLWVRWERLVPPHAVEAVWLDPTGSEAASAVVTITDGATDQFTDFSLALAPSSTVGVWEVVLYLDDVLQRSHTFDVLSSP
jgi:hypothetical protein